MTFKAGWAFESGTVEGWAILSGSSAPTVSASNPRTGNYALAPGLGTYIYAPIGDDISDPIAQFCNRHVGNLNELRFGLLHGSTWVAWVQFNAQGNPTLHYNGGQLTEGPNLDFVYSETDYHTVEINMTTIGASGDITLRIDGDDIIVVENVDTRASAGAITSVNRVGLFVPFGTNDDDVDDVVVFDHSGVVNNSWPDGVGGNPRKVTQDGTYEQWDASTGSDHYALLDEVPASSSDYIQTGAGGEKDSFQMQDVTGLISGTYDIAAFQVCHLSYEPNGPSAQTIDPFIIVDSVDHQDGVDHTLTSTLAFYQGKPWETNPETSLAWTAADLDDIEIGISSGA